MKLTEWYPADVKPVREGVYQVDIYGASWFSYWDGERWGWASGNKREAEINRDEATAMWDRKNVMWRGIEKP